MLDRERPSIRRDRDGDGVEPRLTSHRTLCLAEPKPLARHLAELHPLARADRFERVGDRVAPDARADLAEDQRRAIDGDDVKLAVFGAEVPLDDVVAQSREHLAGSLLAGSAARASRISHAATLRLALGPRCSDCNGSATSRPQ